MAEITPIVVAADQESRVRLQRIQRAFLSLPDEQRSALHLVTIEGLFYQEAATTLNIPVGTLMSRLSSGTSRDHQASALSLRPLAGTTLFSFGEAQILIAA